MSEGRDLLCQLQLGPPELPDGTDVPHFFLERQIRLYDDYVLRPADGHSLGHDFRGAFICTVEIPHPPQASGREPSHIRIGTLEIFCGGYSRAFFRPVADHAANAAVQLHLRQICRHQYIQCRKHDTVIGRFSDIHGIFSFPA